jgi:hypothetical protein
MSIQTLVGDMRALAEMLNSAAVDLEAVVRLFGAAPEPTPKKQATLPPVAMPSPIPEAIQAPPFAPDASEPPPLNRHQLGAKDPKKLTKVEKDQIRLLWKQTPLPQRDLNRKRELGTLYGVSARTIMCVVANNLPTAHTAHTTPPSA